MNGTLLSSCLNSQVLVISVIGPHANEGMDAIFARKIGDLGVVGQTYWLVSSSKVSPPKVQEMCNQGGGYVVFIESSGIPRPATIAAAATQYSADNQIWRQLPSELGPVTGNLVRRPKALILDALELYERAMPLDMWAYAEWPAGTSALDTRIGHSTICALKQDTSEHPKRMKSRLRRIVACARLQEPFCVWVR